MRKTLIKGDRETYGRMCTISIKQVSETATDAFLLIRNEINPKREEESSSECAREGLQRFPSDVISQSVFR